MAPILAGLLIFCMRVADMSLDTLRLLFTMRGRKELALLFGIGEAAVFILAVSQVLKGPLNFWTVMGYACGFGTGTVVGMFAEERLALGFTRFSVYSLTRGAEISAALREAGHAVTEFSGHGQSGDLAVVTCAVSRKDAPRVHSLIRQVDPQAFVTLDEVRPLQRGYFRH
jgi:uncharacterized protein YebE (UPF0316 family)